MVVLLAVGTVYAQYKGLGAISIDGNARHFVQRQQTARVDEILRGEGGDPWQFRVASEFLARESERAAHAVGFGDSATVGLLGFRVLQNVAMFALAWALYLRLGLGRRTAAVGLALLAAAMTQSGYNAGLTFDTYGDLLVYLAAGVLILDGRYAWIVPLTVVGAVNRETCGLVPLMLIAVGWQLGRRTPPGRRAVLLGLAALVAFGVTVAVVRVVVGPGHLIVPYGKHQGWELFGFNVGRAITWDHLFRTVTIVPFLALWQLRRWRPELRAFALAVVPIWLAVHLFTAVLAETRLVLVPYALVAIPGALAAVNSAPERVSRHSAELSA